MAGGNGFGGSGASAGIAEICCWAAVSFLLGECWLAADSPSLAGVSSGCSSGAVVTDGGAVDGEEAR